MDPMGVYIYIYIHICKKIAKLLLVLPAFSLVIESPVIGITTDLPGLAPSSDSPEKRAMRIEGCFFDRNVYIYIYLMYMIVYVYPPTPADARGRAPGNKTSKF